MCKITYDVSYDDIYAKNLYNVAYFLWNKSFCKKKESDTGLLWSTV